MSQALVLLLAMVGPGSSPVAFDEMPITARWQSICAQYRQSVSSSPVLSADRKIKWLAYAKTSLTGRLLDKETAHLVVGRGQFAITKTSEFDATEEDPKRKVTRQWRGFDGTAVTSWIQETINDVPGAPVGKIESPGIPKGEMRSEWTPNRLMGEYLHASTVSLVTLLDRQPNELTDEVESGHTCLKARFEGVQVYEDSRAPLAKVEVWFDSSVSGFPRRIRLHILGDVPEAVGIPGNHLDEVADLKVRQFQLIESPDTKLQISIPVAADWHYGGAHQQITFSNVKVVPVVNNKMFQPAFPFATRLRVVRNGVTKDEYIGGQNGEREWMRRQGISEQAIRAIVDKDPVALAAMTNTSVDPPRASEPIMNTEVSNSEAVHPGGTWFVRILQGVALLAAVVAAFWWRRT